MGKSSGAAGVARLRAERNWAAAVWVAGPYAVGFVYSKSCARMTFGYRGCIKTDNTELPLQKYRVVCYHVEHTVTSHNTFVCGELGKESLYNGGVSKYREGVGSCAPCSWGGAPF